MRLTDLLVLRDEESAAVLAAAGAPAPFRIGADPAWTLAADLAAVASFPGREPTITVALSHPPATAPSRRTWPPRSTPFMATHSVRLQPWQVGAGADDVELADTIRDATGP